ncbi:MAG: OB-fold domain-containing protein [Mycobacterium sp.]|nr:OB-fold domain-containing protein [Mycobacterium sp.]
MLSGRAKLHSYVISNRPAVGFAADAPYAIALVKLEEGPQMMSNILEVENVPHELVLDMPLEVTFEQRGDVSIPQFRPTGPR